MSFWYRTMGLVLKLIFGSIAVGSLVGLILPFIIKLFSLDKLFEFNFSSSFLWWNNRQPFLEPTFNFMDSYIVII